MSSHALDTTVRVSIEDMIRDARSYVQRVEAGETIVIMNAGQPVAELKPLSVATASPRPFGLAAGSFVVPDDFDTPLPDSFLEDFEGS